jgi:hypothetical protein
MSSFKYTDLPTTLQPHNAEALSPECVSANKITPRMARHLKLRTVDGLPIRKVADSQSGWPAILNAKGRARARPEAFGWWAIQDSNL